MSTLDALEREPRAHCYRCDKPRFLCLCSRIPRVDNRTPIVILQHKRESRHPLGTVRIADLGLSRCHVEVVPASASSDETLPSYVPERAGLLYPGPFARELAEVEAEALPSALVIVDGTWHQARALFRDHRWLGQLPRFKLTPREPSRYRIRREPRPAYVSSIEAIMAALAILEPELELSGLGSAFTDLVDDQIRVGGKGGRSIRKRGMRPLRVRMLPQALVDGFERMVLVYGEAARPEHEPGAQTELVHWTALRVRDGETFDCVVKPRSGAPSALRLQHLGLARADFAQGVELDALRARWLAFVRPEDVFAAWNPRTLALFEKCLDVPLPGIGLKGVYRRIRRVDGDLERVLAVEGRAALPIALAAKLEKVRGRAQLRVANALAIALFLRSLSA